MNNYGETKWGKRAANRLPKGHKSADHLLRTALVSLDCADEASQPNRLAHQQRAERMLARATNALRAEMEADR
jgi:hypothetical protein